MVGYSKIQNETELEVESSVAAAVKIAQDMVDIMGEGVLGVDEQATLGFDLNYEAACRRAAIAKARRAEINALGGKIMTEVNILKKYYTS